MNDVESAPLSNLGAEAMGDKSSTGSKSRGQSPTVLDLINVRTFSVFFNLKYIYVCVCACMHVRRSKRRTEKYDGDDGGDRSKSTT